MLRNYRYGAHMYRRATNWYKDWRSMHEMCIHLYHAIKMTTWYCKCDVQIQGPLCYQLQQRPKVNGRNCLCFLHMVSSYKREHHSLVQTVTASCINMNIETTSTTTAATAPGLFNLRVFIWQHPSSSCHSVFLLNVVTNADIKTSSGGNTCHVSLLILVTNNYTRFCYYLVKECKRWCALISQGTWEKKCSRDNCAACPECAGKLYSP